MIKTFNYPTKPHKFHCVGDYIMRNEECAVAKRLEELWKQRDLRSDVLFLEFDYIIAISVPLPTVLHVVFPLHIPFIPPKPFKCVLNLSLSLHPYPPLPPNLPPFPPSPEVPHITHLTSSTTPTNRIPSQKTY